jgi:hypothetical protein
MFQTQVLTIHVTVLKYEGREVAMVFSGRTYLFQSKIKDMVIGYENGKGHIPPTPVKCFWIYSSKVEDLNTLTTGIKLSVHNLIKDSWFVYPISNGVFNGEDTMNDYHSFKRLATRMGRIWDDMEVTDPVTLKIARVDININEEIVLTPQEVSYISRHLPNKRQLIGDEDDDNDKKREKFEDDVDDSELK